MCKSGLSVLKKILGKAVNRYIFNVVYFKRQAIQITEEIRPAVINHFRP